MGKPDLIIIATGSEVALVVKTAEELKERGWNVRVVSMPSWFLFEQQDQAYKDCVLLPDVRKRIAVEAGSEFGWVKWVGDTGRIIGMNRYGESGKFEEIYPYLGFSVENIVKNALELLA